MKTGWAPFLVRNSCRTEVPTTSIPKQRAPETSHGQKVQKLNPNTKGQGAGKGGGRQEQGEGKRNQRAGCQVLSCSSWKPQFQDPTSQTCKHTKCCRLWLSTATLSTTAKDGQ